MERAQIESIIVDMATKARRAARVIGVLPTAVKNRILLDVARPCWPARISCWPKTKKI